MGKPGESEVSLLMKYSMFFFNLFFWLAGGVLLSIGIWARREKGMEVFGDLFADPAVLFILVGVIMFLVGFFGCLGALRENVMMLRLFMWSLVILILLQIIGAILAFVFRDELEDKARENLDDAIVKYRDDDDLRNLIDFIQEEFCCCGANDPKDWTKNRYFSCSQDPNLAVAESCGVPFSCCKTSDQRVNSQCGYGVNDVKSEVIPSQTIWTGGCVDALMDWAEDNMLAIAVTVLVVAIVQILGIALSGTLIQQIHRQSGYI